MSVQAIANLRSCRETQWHVNSNVCEKRPNLICANKSPLHKGGWRILLGDHMPWPIVFRCAGVRMSTGLLSDMRSWQCTYWTDTQNSIRAWPAGPSLLSRDLCASLYETNPEPFNSTVGRHCAYSLSSYCECVEPALTKSVSVFWCVVPYESSADHSSSDKVSSRLRYDAKSVGK
jgi:hypothetical protein